MCVFTRGKRSLAILDGAIFNNRRFLVVDENENQNLVLLRINNLSTKTGCANTAPPAPAKAWLLQMFTYQTWLLSFATHMTGSHVHSCPCLLLCVSLDTAEAWRSGMTQTANTLAAGGTVS